ncbi:hypothetical protein [Micromonospora sp. NPDC005413]|uniref:hypothetical protein n=1 Tax=Micromonospora sp. NPDC005413 TaxID=3154563 RepID=UPI0033BADCCD
MTEAEMNARSLGGWQLTDQQLAQLVATLRPVMEAMRARVAGDDQKWLDKTQLAARLQVSVSLVDLKVAGREIPHHRVGRLVRFTPADIAEIERLMQEPTRNFERESALALTSLRAPQQPRRRPRRQ